MLEIRNVSKSDPVIVSTLIRIFQNKSLLFLENSFSDLIVCYKDGSIIGYLSYSFIYDRMEINYIVVLDEFRGQGIGSCLMEYFISFCERVGCLNITLEVNEHNHLAICLYSKFGFSIVSKRDHYYPDGDGYLMIKEFDLI